MICLIFTKTGSQKYVDPYTGVCPLTFRKALQKSGKLKKFRKVNGILESGRVTFLLLKTFQVGPMSYYSTDEVHAFSLLARAIDLQ